MNNIQISGVLTVWGGKVLKATTIGSLLLLMIACGNENPPAPTAQSAVVEPMVNVGEASEALDQATELVEIGSQEGLKKKLQDEHQELIDMNQRKAELEAEISQIKQAISEADRAIQQKEQELEHIRQTTSTGIDS